MILVLGVKDNINISININPNINGGDNNMDDVSKSILLSVKKMVGVHPESIDFDTDLIIHINSTFMILRQLGIGPKNGFSIIDKTSEWTDFIPETNENFEGVKTYVGAKVKLIFDPPMSSVVKEALKEVVNEMEFRLNVEAETPVGNEVME